MAEKDDAPAASGSEDFATLFAASEATDAKRGKTAVGDVVRGRVIAIGQTSAFVGIGAVSREEIAAITPSSRTTTG